jgi:hypothetical protein
MLEIIVSGSTWFGMGFVCGISLIIITNLIMAKNEK